MPQSGVYAPPAQTPQIGDSDSHKEILKLARPQTVNDDGLGRPPDKGWIVIDPENPFSRLKARWLFTYAFLLLIVSILITAAIWPAQVAEGMGSLPNAVLGVSWEILILLVLMFSGWRANLKWPKLVGKPPTFKLLLRVVPIAIPLIAISIGTFYLAFYPLSFIAPGMVESILRSQWEEAKDLTGGIGPDRFITLAINVLGVVVLAPITEELLFRGYLLHRWSLKWGIRRGMVLSCGVFGLLHMEHFLGILVVGFVLSALYVETKSLIISIVLHAANNFFALLWLLLDSALVDRARPPTIIEFRADWWAGVLSLAVGVPWLVYFVRRRWGLFSSPLPYSQ